MSAGGVGPGDSSISPVQKHEEQTPVKGEQGSSSEVSKDGAAAVADRIAGLAGTGAPVRLPESSVPPATDAAHGKDEATTAETDKMVSSLMAKGVSPDKASAQELAQTIRHIAKIAIFEANDAFSSSVSKKPLEAVIRDHKMEGKGGKSSKDFQVMRTKTGGLYVIFPKKVLGKGGYKTVYFGVDVKTGEALAIGKTDTKIKAETGKKATGVEREATRQLGRREAELVRNIHEGGEKNGVMGVRDIVDFASGEQVVVMELMGGGDLDGDAISEMEPDQLFQVARDAAEGLSNVHTQGITHRDLKKGNIFVNTDGRAKIGDFGLSGKEDVRMKGTPTEWSPEVFAGENMSKASDVFAFGMIIYDLFLKDYVTMTWGSEFPIDPKWKEKVFEVMINYKKIKDLESQLQESDVPEDQERLRGEIEDHKDAYIKLWAGKAPFFENEEAMGFPFPDPEWDVVEIPKVQDIVEEKSFRGLVCRCCRCNPEDRPSMEEVRQDLDELMQTYTGMQEKAPETSSFQVLMNLFGKNMVEEE